MRVHREDACASNSIPRAFLAPDDAREEQGADDVKRTVQEDSTGDAPTASSQHTEEQGGEERCQTSGVVFTQKVRCGEQGRGNQNTVVPDKAPCEFSIFKASAKAWL